MKEILLCKELLKKGYLKLAKKVKIISKDDDVLKHPSIKKIIDNKTIKAFKDIVKYLEKREHFGLIDILKNFMIREADRYTKVMPHRKPDNIKLLIKEYNKNVLNKCGFMLDESKAL